MNAVRGRQVVERARRLGLAALLYVTCATAVPATPYPLAALLACRDLADAPVRLACFDRESAALARAAAAPTLAPEQTFGLGSATIAAKESATAQRPELAQVQARVAGIGYRTDGRSEFTLDNGQVWRQTTSGDELLLNKGDVVKLSRGALHSFWLSAPSGRRCKVTRV